MSAVSRSFIEAMLKQLPPSASELHLLDVGGLCGGILQEHRPDVRPIVASLLAEHWFYPESSISAVVGYDVFPSAALLAQAWRALRPGGRLILVLPLETMAHHTVWADRLRAAGFVRLLIEPALSDGLLLRGERPHQTQDTLARVRQVADQDADALDLAAYRGRFLHLLVQQTPNKPPWRLDPHETLIWQAACLPTAQGLHLLAFSSLPKAVAFLQAAVLEQGLSVINKVAKFPKEAAAHWALPLWLNPSAMPAGLSLAWHPVDPDQAAAPDE